MSEFKKVIMYNLTDLEANRVFKIINNPEDIQKYIDGCYCPIELIGCETQQVKPCFDIDFQMPENQVFEEVFKLSQWCNIIKDLFGREKLDIKILTREKTRKKGNNIKYSYHFIVNNIRMKNANVKRLIEAKGFKKDEPFDLTIYSKNRGLFPIYSNKKYNRDTQTNDIVPRFIPIDMFRGDLKNFNIFDYCPSYIEESFEDWDLKMEPIQVEKKANDLKFDDDDIEETNDNDTSNKFDMIEIITRLNASRAYAYDEWLNFNFALMNIGDKLKMNRKKIYEMCDLFSAKCKEKYDENTFYDWFNEKYSKKREVGYRFKFILDRLKIDDPEYYKNMMKPKIHNYSATKELFEKENFLIKKPLSYVHILNEKPVFYKKGDFTSLYEGKKYTVVKKADKRKKDQKDEIVECFFINNWFKDDEKRIFDEVVWLPPPIACPHTSYNTWKPFKLSLVEAVPDERDYWKEFLEFANNLFGDVKVTDYILARYAYRLQNPGLRSYVCVIYYGAEGDGKSQFINTIYSLFDEYTVQIDDAKKLYDSHSMFEYQKCFVCVNEASGVANFQNADILKTRITENKTIVNPKGIQSYEADNLVDYDNTTNHENVLKISDDSSRRFFQVETTSFYSGNSEFWNDFIKCVVKNPIAHKQIYDGLIKMDVNKVIPSGNFQDRKDKPVTEVFKRVKQMNRDKIICFLQEKCERAEKDDVEKYEYTNTQLFESWNNWVTDCKFKIEYNKVSFGMKMGNIGKKIEKAIKKVGVFKDTHSNTVIYTSVIAEYISHLEKE